MAVCDVHYLFFLNHGAKELQREEGNNEANQFNN
jgi:hypothetical protein